MDQTGKKSERGGARLKFLIFIVVVACLAYVGYLFIPVAYESYAFKDFMQHKVDVAAIEGYPTAWVQDQIAKAASEYGVPPDALIEPQQQDQRIILHVQFTRPIEFPGYTYDYEFDHTVKSTAFLTFK